MKKKYAVCDNVPISTTYLTSGKKYEILEENPEDGLFTITSDDDFAGDCLCCYKECAHLLMGDWTIIEEEE